MRTHTDALPRLLECNNKDAHNRFGLWLAQLAGVADRDAPPRGLLAGSSGQDHICAREAVFPPCVPEDGVVVDPRGRGPAAPFFGECDVVDPCAGIAGCALLLAESLATWLAREAKLKD